MSIELDDSTKRLIERLVERGKYANPEDVVRAALHSLEDQQEYGDYAPGELERLLEEGERSLRENGPVPLEDVLAEIHARSNARKQSLE